MYHTIEDCFVYFKKLPVGSLMEFGVFSGNTMNRLIKGAEAQGNVFTEVWGFDSFCGLPKEAENVYQNPEWPEGAFNVQKDFGLKSTEEAMTFVRGNVERKDINLIPGFYSDTLPKMPRGMHQCSFLHVDVDIYQSTKEVLDFVFQRELLKNGALIRYDDWMSTPQYQGGNSLAHIEAEEKYKVEFETVGTNLFRYWGQCV